MVITLLVLLIDASINSRSPAPQQALAAGTWVDRVLPVIASSNSEGQVLAAVWSNGLKTPAPAVASQVEQVAAGAAKDYSTVVGLRPPSTLGGPAGLLGAALLARSKAAADLQRAILGVLGPAAVATGARTGAPAAAGSPPGRATSPAEALSDVTSAGSEIQFGDQAYQMFLSTIPGSVGVRMPSSAWGGNPAPYTASSAQVFLAALQSTSVTTPVYQVRIYGISTNPAAVASSGATRVIPDATAMTLTIVVADTGNQPADNLTVTASISPAGHGSSSVRDFLNLAVGQAYTIDGLGPLNPPQGVPVTLTVAVTAPAGSLIPPYSQTLVFQMPAPPPPSTTSTTTTTRPGSSTTTGGTTPPTT